MFVVRHRAACSAALQMLVSSEKISPDERVVIFITGSGIKYLECYEGWEGNKPGNLVPSYHANARLLVSKASSGECPSGCGLQILFKSEARSSAGRQRRSAGGTVSI